jgi:tetratricopeptide (TPR) repeat protein
MSDNEFLQQSAAWAQQTLLQAIAYQQAGQVQDAERLYRGILQNQPRHPDANHNLGLIAVQAKQVAAGLPYLKAALEANPGQWQYWLSYTDALLAAGQAKVALSIMEIGRQRGLDTPAARAQRQKIEIALQNDSALSNAQTFAEIEQLFVFFNAGRHLEAENGALGMLGRHPNLGIAWKLLGAAQEAQGKNAFLALQKAVSLLPGDAEVHFNLGIALHDLEQIGDAEASYRRAVEIKPDFAGAHNNLGLVLKDLGLHDDAVAAHRRALEIMPDFADAHNNLGMDLKDLGLLEEAVTSYRRALQINPDFVNAYHNLGNALSSLRRFDDAIECYQRALQIKPDYAEARLGLAMIMLYLGNFAEGWKLYEARYDASRKKSASTIPAFGFPQWQGQPLTGKTVLVLKEQGLGDQIQFCRYLPILKARGASRIAFLCDASLKPLVDRLAEVDDVLVTQPILEAFDYWTLLLSLPLYCNTTTVDDIPAAAPYLFADPKRQHEWAAQFANIAAFKVGVCWQGSKGYLKDSDRSPGLNPFKKLFDLTGVRFLTLQPGSRDEFVAAAGDGALDIGREIDAQTFEETAALIMNLDLVITCDTAVGHLAGALGKIVWVVLPFCPDWRWLVNREDSPWYANTRVFRQTHQGDWDALFERVAWRLQAVVAGESSALWPVQDNPGA